MNLSDLINYSISIDSRTIQPGEVFLALKGPNFDGHQFINQAIKNGAVAVITEHDLESKVPIIKVLDSKKTLVELARERLKYLAIPTIALTGSCGKTTCKTMLGNILQQCGQTLVTEENNNNTIGVPLTLLRATSEDQFAVIEIGTSEIGEIGYSAAIVKPEVALITNAAPVHLDGLGTLDGVAEEKGQLLRHLSAAGTAVLNLDDNYYKYWLNLLTEKQRVISFGFNQKADFYPVITGESFVLHSPEGEIEIKLQLLGKHNIANALAAAAAATAIGASLAEIKVGLEATTPVTSRLVFRQGMNGATVIDDSYNANPTAMRYAIEVLVNSSGKKILVIGDMAELGQEKLRYHRELGLIAKKMAVDNLLAIGELTPVTVEAFGEGAWHFTQQSELIEFLKPLLTADSTVLVKGSNCNKLWHVVEKIEENS